MAGLAHGRPAGGQLINCCFICHVALYQYLQTSKLSDGATQLSSSDKTGNAPPAPPHTFVPL